MKIEFYKCDICEKKVEYKRLYTFYMPHTNNCLDTCPVCYKKTEKILNKFWEDYDKIIDIFLDSLKNLKKEE